MDPALTAAAIGVGGTVIVGVAGFWANVRNTNKTTALTLRAVELTEQGQVTDRYSKAIEQLGSSKLDVRIGGIYALERVARDSPRDHPTIMEVLATLIREHSRRQWPPGKDSAEPSDSLPRPDEDVQAAATVIGRRAIRHDSQQIQLYSVDLTRVYLPDANLTGANFYDANLAGATLAAANLTRADFRYANLTRAVLEDADLPGANLKNAKLTGADLTGTHLTGAEFTHADLRGADLTGAHWPRAVAVPPGWQRDTASGQLIPARTDSSDAATD